MRTSLSCSPENVDRLSKLGTARDSLNDILTRVLDHYEKCKHKHGD